MHCSVSLPSVLAQGSEQDDPEAPGTAAMGALENANKKETHGRRTRSCALGSKGVVTARHVPLGCRAWVQAGGQNSLLGPAWPAGVPAPRKASVHGSGRQLVVRGPPVVREIRKVGDHGSMVCRSVLVT